MCCKLGRFSSERSFVEEIDRTINFDFIDEEVKGVYSEAERGKLEIDPVSLF